MKEGKSFLDSLVGKEAYVRGLADKTGVNAEGVVAEVRRQMKQVSIQRGGDPITGEGVTKSGKDN